MSRSISSEKVNTSIINHNKYIYQGNKSLGKNIKFAPILEEQINNISRVQDINNISSVYNNNNNSSFENSNIDYNTMSKFRPSLNLSCLPPIFEIPKQRLDKNVLNTLELDNNKSISNPKNNNSIYYETNNPNIKMMRGSKFNLKNLQPNTNEVGFNNTAQGNDNKNSIKLNKNQNFLPPINNHTYYNNNQLKDNNMGMNLNNINMNKNRQKVLLKPIQIKNMQYKNGGGSSNNIYSQQINNNLFVKNPTTIDIINNINIDKMDEKTMKYFYDITNKNIIRSEKLKEERALRTKEMSNISIGQNKNYIDKNIVIINNKENKDSQKNLINNISNSSIFKGNKDEFISINRTKTKVLHIPTLQIFDRYDISIKNYSLYENYIKNWLKIMRGTLQIKYIIENDQINCYSIIIERSKNCSLGNLLRSVGSINEYILKNISKQILPLIKICESVFDYRVHDINEQLYNYIDINNIWINEKYNVLLYPGKLNAKFNKVKNNNIENFLKMNFGLNKDNNILIKDTDNQTNNNNMQLNIDLMNFGITLININIYILKITVNDLFELTPINNSNYSNNCCCLFHFFFNNNVLFKNLYETLLKSNLYTEEYINFLHTLTNLDTNEKNLYETISNHSFIASNSSNINNGPNINELIKIGKIYDFSNEYFTSNSNIENFDLIKQKISGRLGVLKEYYENYGIKDIKTLFSIYNVELDELCRELRINFDELQDKLLIIYESIFDEK